MVSIHLWQAPGAMPAAIAGIQDLFQLANRFSEQPMFSVTLINEPADTAQPQPTIVILPPFIDERWQQVGDAAIARLRQHHQSGVVIAASCAAVFWLAEAGLLDGKIATTHWSLFEHLQRSYPAIKTIDQRQLVIDQGRIITGAGLFAFQDLVLHLIIRYDSYTTAKRVADYAMLDISGRLQSHYQRFYPDYSHGDSDVLAAQSLCEQRPEQQWNVSKLANHLALSERTLARRFEQALKMTPSHYLRKLRLELAKQKLESTRDSIDQIGADVGYSDLSNFVRAFRNNTGITPAEFRARKG